MIKLTMNQYFFPKAVEKVMKIGSKYPMETNVDMVKECMCVPLNETEEVMNTTDWSNMTTETCTEVC